MCIITFHLHQHPTYKLILLANRDEFYDRPTAPAYFWEDHPSTLAGRDLKAMGTWMGVTKQGRIAALTNYRNPSEEAVNKQSRGHIVRSFLTSDLSAKAFCQALQNERESYNGFNLLAGTPDQLYF